MSKSVTRRQLLRAGIVGAAGTALAELAGAAPPPAETGLPYEGLLKGKLGFQPRKLLPPPFASIPGFLSEKQVDGIYRAYQASFFRLLRAEQGLRTASRAAADSFAYGALRRQQVEAGNSVLLHEFYLGNITETAPALPSYVRANMKEHMGSLTSWREDFAACARIATAWAMLVYDSYDDRWHNVALGAADAGGWVGSNPLVVCSTADWAWQIDYKSRDDYAVAFLNHIDWQIIAKRYRAADRH